MAEDTKKATAAYLPFKTFLSSIETLDHGLPRKLDRTVWRSQSGIVQGQIMIAYRFLRLINDADEPTELLQALVEKPSQRAKLVGEMLHVAYTDVLAHDLTKMSPKMLEELMGTYGVQGDTRRKAIAFLLRAAKYAELPMHPLLIASTRNSSNGVRKKRKAAVIVQALSTPQVPTTGEATQMVSKTVYLPSGTAITLHIAANWIDMEQTEREYVFGLIDRIRDAPVASADDEEEEEEEQG